MGDPIRNTPKHLILIQINIHPIPFVVLPHKNSGTLSLAYIHMSILQTHVVQIRYMAPIELSRLIIEVHGSFFVTDSKKTSKDNIVAHSVPIIRACREAA